MTNQRVAGLLWKEIDGIPLILTLESTNSKVEDYSVTTVTGTLKKGDNKFSAMAETIKNRLGIERRLIVREHVMFEPMESLNKVYTWCLFQVEPETKIIPCSDEIKDYWWNPPVQLPLMVDKMRAGRKYMFEQALAEACRREYLSRAHFPFLPEPVTKPMPVMA